MNAEIWSSVKGRPFFKNMNQKIQCDETKKQGVVLAPCLSASYSDSGGDYHSSSIAPVGQTLAHVPQEIHVSGSIE